MAVAMSMWLILIITASRNSTHGTFLATWGSEGSEDGQFNSPYGIAVDGSGKVYVADSGNHRIQKFSSKGIFLATWGSNGLRNGQFDSPHGIAVDGSGNVYVADSGNHRIQKFNPDGTFLATWGSQGSGNGQFYFPWHSRRWQRQGLCG